MKKFFYLIWSCMEIAGRAKAATALTRMGRWREAQSLMNK